MDRRRHMSATCRMSPTVSSHGWVTTDRMSPTCRADMCRHVADISPCRHFETILPTRHRRHFQLRFKGLWRVSKPIHFVTNLCVPPRFYCACFYCRRNDNIAEARAPDRPWLHASASVLGGRLLGDHSLKFPI